ncbi:hypothetical protein IRB23M11_22320 [Alkalibacterium sp. m-11]
MDDGRKVSVNSQPKTITVQSKEVPGKIITVRIEETNQTLITFVPLSRGESDE